MAKHLLPEYAKLIDTICTAQDDKTVVSAVMLGFLLYAQGKIGYDKMAAILDRASDKFFYFQCDD